MRTQARVRRGVCQSSGHRVRRVMDDDNTKPEKWLFFWLDLALSRRVLFFCADYWQTDRVWRTIKAIQTGQDRHGICRFRWICLYINRPTRGVLTAKKSKEPSRCHCFLCYYAQRYGSLCLLLHCRHRRKVITNAKRLRVGPNIATNPLKTVTANPLPFVLLVCPM
jgi:hypothetical protein